MESTVKQRLVQFIKMMHLTQKAFEERCGMGNGYVNSIRKGIGPEKMQDIIRAFPELNRAWLLFGEGEMLKTTSPTVSQTNINGDNNYVIGNNTIGDVSNSNISNVGHGQNYPTLLEARESEVECPKCGELIIVKNPTVLSMVPKEITRRPNINLEQWRRNHPQQMKKIDFSQIWGEEPFVVQVDTRAMEPDYREGTFLVLQPLPDTSYATADGIAYVVDTMKPHTLFRNLTDKYDGTYVLTANNDKRSYIRLKAEDIITVYDIVGSFRIGR